MNKSIRNLCCCGLALLMTSSGQSVEAGIIPWTYNAIFGPVGSTFGHRRAFYGPMGRAAFYQGSVCCPTSPCAPCGTCGHTAGYAPYTVGYSSYYAPATSFGCSTCGPTSCPGGNCGYYTPATGSTMAPAQSSTTSSPTPTQTFKSTEPTVNPEALERRRQSYDDDDGFEKPTRPNGNSTNGSNSSSSEEKKEDAPLFGNPFGSSSSESLKVPMGPPVPVEKRQPAPATEPETNKGGLSLPPIRFEPDPVAVSEKPSTWERTRTASRSVRASNYSIPDVARNSSGNTDSFVPPLPTPLQLVGK